MSLLLMTTDRGHVPELFFSTPQEADPSVFCQPLLLLKRGGVPALKSDHSVSLFNYVLLLHLGLPGSCTWTCLQIESFLLLHFKL